MKILIVSQYYYPEQFLINEIAPELVKNGNEVTVITGLPNYPSGVIDREYRNFQKRHEVIDGVKVIRCPIIARGKSTIRLALNYISFVVTGAMKVLFLANDYDVVFCYELSPVTQALPGILYSYLYKKKLILYCLDIFPESIIASVGSCGVIYSAVHSISKFIYNSCDKILVTSKPFIDYLVDVNSVDREKLEYLPQHANSKMLEMDLRNSDKGINNFMFAGNMGMAQVLDVIVNAVEILKYRKDFLVHMVGDGSKLSETKKLVQDKGLGDFFVFYGHVPSNQMSEYYKKADCLLVTLRGNNRVGDTLPGKVQMYMTTGKPIIGAMNGAGYEVINESGCGKCAKAGDYEGLAKYMEEFITNPLIYEKCGEKGKAYYCANFTFEKYIEKLEFYLRN